MAVLIDDIYQVKVCTTDGNAGSAPVVAMARKIEISILKKASGHNLFDLVHLQRSPTALAFGSTLTLSFDLLLARFS